MKGLCRRYTAGGLSTLVRYLPNASWSTPDGTNSSKAHTPRSVHLNLISQVRLPNTSNPLPTSHLETFNYQEPQFAVQHEVIKSSAAAPLSSPNGVYICFEYSRERASSMPRANPGILLSEHRWRVFGSFLFSVARLKGADWYLRSLVLSLPPSYNMASSAEIPYAPLDAKHVPAPPSPMNNVTASSPTIIAKGSSTVSSPMIRSSEQGGLGVPIDSNDGRTGLVPVVELTSASVTGPGAAGTMDRNAKPFIPRRKKVDIKNDLGVMISLDSFKEPTPQPSTSKSPAKNHGHVRMETEEAKKKRLAGEERVKKEKEKEEKGRAAREAEERAQHEEVFSALASARNIENIDAINYPEGIKSPKIELNLNAQSGKFRSDVPS